MEVTKVKTTNRIEFTLTDEEYKELNEELESLYKRIVVDSQEVSTINMLWKFKDMLTMAVKG